MKRRRKRAKQDNYWRERELVRQTDSENREQGSEKQNIKKMVESKKVYIRN